MSPVIAQIAVKLAVILGILYVAVRWSVADIINTPDADKPHVIAMTVVLYVFVAFVIQVIKELCKEQS